MNIFCLLFTFSFIQMGSCVYIYGMDTMCGQTFNLTSLPNGLMRLKTTKNTLYANNMNCTLVLETRLADHVKFTIESVHTERCDLDYLQVMDGNTNIAGLTDGKICGYGPVGRVFRSFGNSVTLRFISDNSAPMAGISLHVEIESGVGVYMDTYCGQIIDFPSFQVSSLRLRLTHAALYTGSSNCSVLFTTRPSERFEIHFGNTNIENCTQCSCDWLEARDGNSRQTPYLTGIDGKICGNRSDLAASVYRTKGNSLYLLFVSDPNIGGNGFNLTIVSSHTGISETTQPTSTTSTIKPYVSTSAIPLHKVQETLSVGCNENSWTIGVNMDRLRKIYPDATASDIYLGENRCKGIELAGVLLFHQSLEDCLSGHGSHNGLSTFTNELIYAEHDPAHPFIIRHYKWTIGVECDVQANGTVSASFNEHSTTPQSIPASQYPVNISFYLDPNFAIEISGTPLKAAAGTNVYVKVFTTKADWNTVMKVQSCYTIPSTNATEDKKFSLIKDGCEIDTNTHIISQSSHETRFQFEDFEYVDSHSGLFLKCDVIFCTSLDWSTRCRQKCVPVVRRNAKKEEMKL